MLFRPNLTFFKAEGVILKLVFVNYSKNCLILLSDNPNHPDQELPIEERENLVIGQA